jgi:glycosyltransferase involved in cell wall biosynthesis
MQVSVIIPTYNSARFLTAAVESVLKQTFKDFEVIVIDDGSTDNTSEIIKQFGDSVRYIFQKNQGVSVARNTGIKNSAAKYVAFLDADDVWMPTKLEKQIAALKENPKSKVCYTEYLSVSSDLKPQDLRRLRCQNEVLSDLLLRGNVIGPPSTVFGERGIFEELGGFDSNLSLSADWDMWIRLASVTEWTFIKEPLLMYRLHSLNMGRNSVLLEEDTLRLLEKSFAMTNLSNELRAKRNAAFAYHYLVFAKSYFSVGQYKNFLRCLMRSISTDVKQIRRFVISNQTVGNNQSALNF